MDISANQTHQGINTARIRTVRKLTQDGVARELTKKGIQMTQRRYSDLESSSTVAPEVLSALAEIFNVDEDLLKYMPNDGQLNFTGPAFDNRDNSRQENQHLNYAISVTTTNNSNMSSDILKYFVDREKVYEGRIKDLEEKVRILESSR
jgi:transcriptional regulator with XRE-family HTH domain